MTTEREPPMAEPGKRPSGASTGGIAANAVGGIADALQRSAERGDDDALGPANTGEGVASGVEPRIDLGGKDEPGSASGVTPPSPELPSKRDASPASSAAPRDRGALGRPGSTDEPCDEPCTAPADEPRDESAAESLGRAVSDVVTGSRGAPSDTLPGAG